MRPEVVELTVATLGLRPYVLIEVVPDDTEKFGFKLALSAGGGIGNEQDIRAALAMTLTSMCTDADPETLAAIDRLFSLDDDDVEGEEVDEDQVDEPGRG